jgi:hypothetical protein
LAIRRGGCLFGPLLLAGCLAAPAGEEAFLVPPAEMRALDAAITRELHDRSGSSQMLGDLLKLKNRLTTSVKTPAPAGRREALAPLSPEDSLEALRSRLEAEADGGGRAAIRSLAFFHMFMNDPEKALDQWRRMGKATEYDVSHLLVAAYLEFALGEYGAGRADLVAAQRLLDSRSGLALSSPVFCSNIMGYRVYVPRQGGDLAPGEDTLIYVEVEGAEFFRTGEGQSCRLTFGLRLRDAGQATLWAEPAYGEYAPVFSGPIRDLHVALSWRVPNYLEAGRYHLLIEAVDANSKLAGESSLSFNAGRRETEAGGRRDSLSPREGKTLRDAERVFPGAPSPPGLPGFSRDQFELLRRFEQGQRVE